MVFSLILLLVLASVLFFIMWRILGLDDFLSNVIVSVLTPIFLWLYAPVFTAIPKDLSTTIWNENIIALPYIWELEISSVGYGLLVSALFGFFIIYFGKHLRSNTFSEKGIIRKYDEFVCDADELWIVGKRLSFLPKSVRQKEKIKKLKSKCTVLCSKEYSDNYVEEFVELNNSGVNIKVYNKTVKISFRGQIKKTGSKYEGMFVNIEGENGSGKRKYTLKKINNKDLLDFILKGILKVHDNSILPIVRTIALDLDGVYMDGSLSQFLAKANSILKDNLQEKSENSVCFNPQLNKGTMNIVKCLIEMSGASIDATKSTQIKDAWSSTWKPDEKLKKLFLHLSKKNYKIIPFSNLDAENGDMYIRRLDFPFAETQVFSYEIKSVKPDSAFFASFENETESKESEILLIDDQNKVIKAAKDRGWKTFKFPKDTLNKFETMVNGLIERGILTAEEKNEIISTFDE